MAKKSTAKKPHVSHRNFVTRRPAPPVTKFKRPRRESFTVSGATGFPDVIISAIAHGKMLALVKECSIEVGWMASATRDENEDIVINDVYVPLQNCTPATTEISEEGDSAMLMELITAGKASEVNDLHCWGHSHVNMDVGPSGQDEDQTKTFLDLRKDKDFFIRVIGNKRGDLNVHVYLIKQGLVLNNPDLVVLQDELDYGPWAKAEIKAKVTETAAYVAGSHAGMYDPWMNYGDNRFNFAGNNTRGYSSDVNETEYYKGVAGFWFNGQFIEDDSLIASDLIAGDVPAPEGEDYIDGYEQFDPNFNTKGA